jgi:hypothetical protein
MTSSFAPQSAHERSSPKATDDFGTIAPAHSGQFISCISFRFSAAQMNEGRHQLDYFI